MTGNSQTFLDSITEQRKLILGSWKLFCNIFPPRNGLLTYLDCIHMDTIRVVYECSFEQKSECGSTGLQVQACLFFSIAFVWFLVGGSAYQCWCPLCSRLSIISKFSETILPILHQSRHNGLCGLAFLWIFQTTSSTLLPLSFCWVEKGMPVRSGNAFLDLWLNIII